MRVINKIMSNLLKSKFIFGTLVALAMVFVAGSAQAYVASGTLLKMGVSGTAVTEYQTALNTLTTCKVGANLATGYFGSLSVAATKCFQAANNLAVDGMAGPITQMALAGKSVMTGNFPAGCTSAAGYSVTTGMSCASGPSTGLPAGCSSTTGYSPLTGTKCDSTGPSTPTPSGDLEGGAGSVESYEISSSYNNEEVGEDAEDTKVAGLKIESSEDSDIEISAVKLVFDEGSAGSDFEDYAAEVSIWMNGEEYARVDGDAFNDDNAWTKTVSLDSGAIIRSGDTEELIVAISGISNLDSADATDTWTVDFRSVRFEDADGVVTTEDPTTGLVTFSFESFATAADTALKITEGDEDINNARLLNVHATDDTDNVELLSVNIEIEGDSDVTIDSFPVTITTTETTGNDPDDLMSVLYLYADGEQIGSESLSTADADGSTEVVVFDDLDYTIDAEDTVEFVVKAKFYSIADTLDAGDTVQVTFGETETDLATFDAEDESGEDLADGDKTGTVTGDTMSIRDVGFNLAFVSSTAVVSHAGDVANTSDHDRGTFTMVFDVTAFDGDIYIDETAPIETGDGTMSDLTITGTDTYVTSSITSPTATDSTNSLKVDEGTTDRFTITVVLEAGADGLFKVELADLLYALTDVDGDLSYTFNLDDFETPQLFLNFD